MSDREQEQLLERMDEAVARGDKAETLACLSEIFGLKIVRVTRSDSPVYSREDFERHMVN